MPQVTRIRRRIPAEKCIEIVGRLHAHRGAGLQRGAAKMRQQHDVFELEKRWMDRRLPLVHVEPRCRDHAARQGIGERAFVDD